jgi:membrane-associated phospholipid phosphatase
LRRGNGPIEIPAWVDDIDAAVDRAWEPVRHVAVVDRVFYAASAAADFSLLWQACNVGLYLTGRHRARDAARIAMVLGIESLVVNQGVKRLFGRRRPTEHPSERTQHLRQPLTSSFPSGHASAAVVASSLLSASEPRLSPLFRATAAVVAASRLHVRIHHASDVLAGAAVGLVLVRTFRRVVH